MATYTTWFNLALPTVGGDPVVWANMLNGNTAIIDGVLHNHDLSIQANAAAITSLNTSKVGEAPIDGQQYARQNGAWSVVVSSGAAVDSVFGRTGAVVALSADYAAFYLSLGGGTLTGPLTLAGPPVQGLEAATKAYVDNLVALNEALSGVWRWIDNTAMADPGVGNMRGNANTMAACTAFALNKTDNNALTYTFTLLQPGDTLIAGVQGANIFGRYSIASIVDNGTWAQINVVGSGTATGNPPNNSLMNMVLVPDAAGTATGVGEAPNDGQDYWRNSEAWVIGNWTNLDGKPTTFAPSAHTHPISDLQAIPANTVVGNATAGSAVPTALTSAQLTAQLSLFTSVLPGAVPASGGGTTNFMRADGAWAAPAGGGGGGGATSDALQASVALTAGQFVNIYNDAGTGKVRLADAALDRVAHGFVTQAFAASATATFYPIGQLNDQLSGLTPGATYWLSATVPGGVQATAPTGSGVLVQALGDALSASAMRFTGDCYVVLS